MDLGGWPCQMSSLPLGPSITTSYEQIYRNQWQAPAQTCLTPCHFSFWPLIIQCVWDAGYTGMSHCIASACFSCHTLTNALPLSPRNRPQRLKLLPVLSLHCCDLRARGSHSSTRLSSLPAAEGSTLGFLWKLTCWMSLHVLTPWGAVWAPRCCYGTKRKPSFLYLAAPNSYHKTNHLLPHLLLIIMQGCGIVLIGSWSLWGWVNRRPQAYLLSSAGPLINSALSAITIPIRNVLSHT